jgi:glycerophosphoryl diester phosphodiesterase
LTGTLARRQKGSVLLLGHRGASARAPENTRPAFEAAVAAGADGVELDAMVCGSGEVVVCHDDSLERLAGVAWELRRTPYRSLLQADVGTRLGFAPARIPLLEEILRLLPARMLINIELKCDRLEDDGLSVSAARLVQRLGMESRVLFSSFNPLCLARLAHEAPRLRRGLLLDPDKSLLLQDALFAPLTANASIHPADAHVTPARVSAWHARGLQVVVWTVNDPARAQALEAMGVDACITDDPQSLRQGLQALRAH